MRFYKKWFTSNELDVNYVFVKSKKCSDKGFHRAGSRKLDVSINRTIFDDIDFPRARSIKRLVGALFLCRKKGVCIEPARGNSSFWLNRVVLRKVEFGRPLSRKTPLLSCFVSRCFNECTVFSQCKRYFAWETFSRKTSKTNMFFMPHVLKTCSQEGSQNAPRGAKVLAILFSGISLHHGPQNDPKTITKH